MLLSPTTLPIVLDQLGVPRRAYSVGGRAEMAWCITRADQERWQVAFWERGSAFDVSMLESVEDACHLLLGRLVLDHVPRPLPVAAPDGA